MEGGGGKREEGGREGRQEEGRREGGKRSSSVVLSFCSFVRSVLVTREARVGVVYEKREGGGERSRCLKRESSAGEGKSVLVGLVA